MSLTRAELAVGIDFGTSGCRAVAIDGGGAVRAEVQQPLPSPERRGVEVEQNPALWAAALDALLAQLVAAVPAGDIGALAVDATSGTVLLAEVDGVPLGPALMYNDGRATAEAAAIAA
ncbi:MAG: carbohydrate kinase, partial [Gammaproteobacteria bacterium HGW-Gammaproteobacteria-1]